jgi:hypothetical protein
MSGDRAASLGGQRGALIAILSSYFSSPQAGAEVEVPIRTLELWNQLGAQVESNTIKFEDSAVWASRRHGIADDGNQG